MLAFVAGDAAVFVVPDEVFAVVVRRQFGVAQRGRCALSGRGDADFWAQAVVGVGDAAAGAKQAGGEGEGDCAEGGRRPEGDGFVFMLFCQVGKAHFILP